MLLVFSESPLLAPAKKIEALAKPPASPCRPSRPVSLLGRSPQLPLGQRLFIVWVSHYRDWRGPEGHSREVCVCL